MRFLAGKIIPLSRSGPDTDHNHVFFDLTHMLQPPRLNSELSAVCRVPLLRILLTNTKVPRSTKVLVSGVKDKINKVLNDLLAPMFHSSTM